MLKNRELSGGSCQLLMVTVKTEYFKPSTMHKFSIKFLSGVRFDHENSSNSSYSLIVCLLFTHK